MSVRSARTDCKSIVVIRGVVIRAEVMVRSADPFSVKRLSNKFWAVSFYSFNRLKNKLKK